MRTTITISDDVLSAAKEIARESQCTAGEVISDYFRKGYAATVLVPEAEELSERDLTLADLGVVRLPHRGEVVTNDDVNRIRDELGI